MTLDLAGRVALVTGASRGIGEAVARAFGEAGATVGVHYGRNGAAAEALAAEIGRGSRALGADLADAHAAQRLWDDALAAFGRVDVLVNNAGVALAAPPEGDLDGWLEAWERTMAVNLTAAAVLCRAAAAHWATRHAAGGGPVVGRMVNVASRAAFRGDTPDYLAYAASKAGLVALTRSIARGWGRRGTAAFVVAPGFTRTDMAQDFIDAYGEDYATGDLALGRMTEPADVAPLVVFLASGLADHATGAAVDVNAGSYVR